MGKLKYERQSLGHARATVQLQHGSPKTRTYDFLILKILTWLRGSEPHRSLSVRALHNAFPRLS